MELAAAFFGVTMIVVSAWLTYHWGIKPDREQRRQRTAELNAKMRRQRNDKPANYGKQRDVTIRDNSPAALSR